MTVRETAEAIVAIPADAILTHIDWVHYDDDGVIDCSHANLDAMARLWLMREDLRDAVEECLNEAQAASYQRPRRIAYYTDLLAKLKALEGVG